MATCLQYYRQQNIELKKQNKDFQVDMNVLLSSKLNWNFEEAFGFVVDNIVNKLP